MAKVCTEEQFLKDIAEHKMTVDLDQGLYRCVRFIKDRSNNQWFSLTTWPGYLAIAGDMGNYVFSRLSDMFEFFRYSSSGPLYINTGYWAEKCVSEDRRCQIERYSETKFADAVKQDFDQFWEEQTPRLRKAHQKDCWQEIDQEVLSAEGEHEAYTAVSLFEFQFEDESFTFQDFWEHDLKDYTYQYVWCCYAIAWGIRQYDAQKKPVEASA